MLLKVGGVPRLGKQQLQRPRGEQEEEQDLCESSYWNGARYAVSKILIYLQNGHSPPPSFRMASSTAYNANSWRGDHPMKPQAGKYFEHEPRQHGGNGGGGGNGSHSHSHNIR